jgi:hypothetical protein
VLRRLVDIHPRLLRLSCIAALVAGCGAAPDAYAPGLDTTAGPSATGGSLASDGGDAMDAGVVDGEPAESAEAGAPQRPIVAPDSFATTDVDVVTLVRTDQDRHAISPLIYGINGNAVDNPPAALMKGVTLVRRGGDRGNSYNWETNVSNGSSNNGFANDMLLANGIPDATAPAGQDLARLVKNRAAGRATMVPFVLGDYVSGPVSASIPYDQAGFDRTLYFHRVKLVKPTPFASTPDLTDGVVYTDEHLAYMMSKFADDITAPGPGKLIVGIDNEPDLYDVNFPMLQQGAGVPLFAWNGNQIGTRVTGPEFTQRLITFATRVRQIAPHAQIVGPSHYHFDGFTRWHELNPPAWSDTGRWFMDDFLADMQAASKAAGTRLLDTWDFHWYPQPMFGGTYVWNLDDARRPMTDAEIDAVLQGPRSYWDPTYVEGSWVTANLGAAAQILARLRTHLDAGYPGTKLGVSEYFPGGRHHVSSGLATVDTLGVFQRMGVDLAAMWPVGDQEGLAYAFGGIELVRNADGNGLRFADTAVRVEHPEIVESSVYAGSDDELGVTVLVVNKTATSRTFGLRVFGAAALASADVYRIDAAHPSPYHAATEALTKVNAYAYAAPPMSATMIVFRAPP